MFFALSLVIVGLAPQIADWLIGIAGGEQGIYNFLVKLPIIPDKVNGRYVWPGTNQPFDPGAAGFIGPAAIEVFLIIRNISMMFFAAVLIVAAICYVTESMKVMREGTALSILTGSIFALIFMFLALPLYNAVAAVFNELTDPKRSLILGGGMITSIAKNAVVSNVSWLNLGEALAQLFGSMFFLIMTAVALVLVSVLGIMRLFMIGALIAMLPLWIVLRAIPVTRHVGESMIEQLMGLVLASLVSAIILRFGYEVAAVGCFTGLTATIASIATLITAAMMPTILAPRLSGLMTTGALVSSQAVSAAAQTAVGAALGGIAGVGGALAPAAGTALRGYRAGGLSGASAALRSAGYTATGILRGVGAGLGRGVASGFMQGFTQRPFTAMGVAFPSPSAIAGSAVEGTQAGMQATQSQIAGSAGSSLAALLNAQVAAPVPGESGDAGLSWYDSIKDKPGEIGKFFSQVYPEGIRKSLFGTPEAQAALGAAVKPSLDQLAAAKPFLLDRLRVNIGKIANLSDQAKLEAFSDALRDRSTYEARARELMDASFGRDAFTRFDSYEGFYREVLSKGLPQDVTQTAGTMLYALALDGIDRFGVDASKYFTREDRELGRMYYDGLFMNPDGTMKGDEEIGRWLKGNLKMPSIGEEHVKTLGHDFKQMAAQMVREEPALFKNLYENLERGAKYGEWPRVQLTKSNYEDLAREVERIARTGMLAPIEGEAWRGFWENLAPSQGAGGSGGGAAPAPQAPPSSLQLAPAPQPPAARQPTEEVSAPLSPPPQPAPLIPLQPSEAPSQPQQIEAALQPTSSPQQTSPQPPKRASIGCSSAGPFSESTPPLQTPRGGELPEETQGSVGSKKKRGRKYYLHDPEDFAELENEFGGSI